MIHALIPFLFGVIVALKTGQLNKHYDPDNHHR